MAFDITSARNLTEEELKDFNKKEKKSFDTTSLREEIPLFSRSLAQSALQGYTAGTAPYLAGTVEEVRNLPKKINEAKSINDIVKLYKDTGKDFIKGNERFKEEVKNYSQDHPVASTTAEIAGSALGLGKLGLLKNPTLLKTLATSAGYGGLYGLGNTQDKVADFKNAGISAGIGGSLGLLGTGIGKAATKTLNSKFGQAVAHPIKELGKKIFLSTEKSIEPLKHLLSNADTNVPIYNILSNASNKVLQAIKRKDFTNSYSSYAEKFQKLLKGLNKTIKAETEKAYANVKNIDVKTALPKIQEIKTQFMNDVKDISGNLFEQLEKKRVNPKFKLNLDDEQKNIMKTLNKIEIAEKRLANGEVDLNLWQQVRQDLFNDAQSLIDTNGNYKNGSLDEYAYKTYNKIRKTLLDDLESTRGNETAQIATRKYAKVKRLEEEIQEKFGKKYDEGDNVITKALQDLNDKKIDMRVNTIKNNLSKFEDMPELNNYLQELSDTGDLLKVSYAVRPIDTNKSVATLQKGIKGNITGAGISALKDISSDLTLPSKKVQNLANAILKGQVNSKILNKPYNFARFPLFQRSTEQYFNNPVSNFPSITNLILKTFEKGKNPISPIAIKQIMNKYYNKEQ